jgi:hypothetical protein
MRGPAFRVRGSAFRRKKRKTDEIIQRIQIMQFQPKDVICSCGHITNLTTRKLLCIKCGKYVFYNEQERKTHRRQTIYFTVVIVMALGFVTYFFVEMVLGPLKLLME